MHIVYIMCGEERSHEFMASLKSLHLFAKVALNADQNYYHIHVITADTVSSSIQRPLHLTSIVYFCRPHLSDLLLHSCCLSLAISQPTFKGVMNFLTGESCIPAEWYRGGWRTAATKQFQAYISQNGHGGSRALWSLCDAKLVHTRISRIQGYRSGKCCGSLRRREARINGHSQAHAWHAIY